MTEADQIAALKRARRAVIEEGGDFVIELSGQITGDVLDALATHYPGALPAPHTADAELMAQRTLDVVVHAIASALGAVGAALLRHERDKQERGPMVEPPSDAKH